jgi:hypothetical protein
MVSACQTEQTKQAFSQFVAQSFVGAPGFFEDTKRLSTQDRGVYLDIMHD